VTYPALFLREIAVQIERRTLLAVPEFAVQANETIAVVGPNGAGKTTMLHVAALLRRPSAGQVVILGEEATRKNEARLRRSLSVVFQRPILFATTALANAAAGLRFQGLARAEAEQRAMRWLRQFEADHLAARSARQLSGGEAARIALARAFATDPALLLLDEPFAALDAPTRAGLLPLLRDRLRATRAAALLVTHDLDEAFAFGDRVAVMTGGSIAACDVPQALLTRPPSPAVARLLGIETILSARVDGADGDCVALSLSATGPMVRVRARSGSSLAPGQYVTFTMPASAARVVRADEVPDCHWNRLPGVVSRVSPTATGMRLVVATPAPIVAVAPWETDRAGWCKGDAVALVFRADAPHLIPDPP
jgi:tungstate transport system ATP-binding protein